MFSTHPDLHCLLTCEPHAACAAARLMPSSNRRQFVERKARAEYEKHKEAAEPGELDFLLGFARTQLENVVLQAQHLTKLQAQGYLKNP